MWRGERRYKKVKRKVSEEGQREKGHKVAGTIEAAVCVVTGAKVGL